MIKRNYSTQRGQSMVMIMLMLMAFIAMLALVLDGGLAYASRREAQNAADAGALAGAAVLCHPETYGATAETAAAVAKTVAETYATVNNQASSALATIDNTLKTVSVDAAVTYTTTFAAVLGFPVGDAGATASAACSRVCGGAGILPIIWSCRAPVTGDGSESLDCKIKYGESHKYIIMDTLSYDENTKCISEGGSIDCDLDNDGMDDVAAGRGARSWLSIDGGSSTCNISDWILPELSAKPCANDTVTTHMWLSELSGVSNTTFQDAVQLEGRTVLIPVFDTYCEGGANNNCVPNPLPHPEDVDRTDANDTLDFHIETLAAFKIDCVVSKPQSEYCPTRALFIAQNPNIFLPPPGSINENAYLTIEGHFIEDYSPDIMACNPGTDVADVGNYTVTLLP